MSGVIRNVDVELLKPPAQLTQKFHFTHVGRCFSHKSNAQLYSVCCVIRSGLDTAQSNLPLLNPFDTWCGIYGVGIIFDVVPISSLSLSLTTRRIGTCH